MAFAIVALCPRTRTADWLEPASQDTLVAEVSAVAPKYPAFVNERPVESVIFKFADIVPSSWSILLNALSATPKETFKVSPMLVGKLSWSYPENISWRSCILFW